MANLKDHIEWVRVLILGLAVTLASTWLTSFLAGIPGVGKIITFNAILGSSIVIGLIAMVTMYAMDNIKSLEV